MNPTFTPCPECRIVGAHRFDCSLNQRIRAATPEQLQAASRPPGDWMDPIADAATARRLDEEVRNAEAWKQQAEYWRGLYEAIAPTPPIASPALTVEAVDGLVTHLLAEIATWRKDAAADLSAVDVGPTVMEGLAGAQGAMADCADKLEAIVNMAPDAERGRLLAWTVRTARAYLDAPAGSNAVPDAFDSFVEAHEALSVYDSAPPARNWRQDGSSCEECAARQHLAAQGIDADAEHRRMLGDLDRRLHGDLLAAAAKAVAAGFVDCIVTPPCGACTCCDLRAAVEALAAPTVEEVEAQP